MTATAPRSALAREPSPGALMVIRPSRAVLAAAVALAAVVTLSVSQPELAQAVGSPQVTATPATNLDNGTSIAVSLSGADAFEGQSVAFAECNEATAQSHGGSYGSACTNYGSNLVVAGGSAHGTVTAVYGQLPNNPAPSNSCTEANNGTCTIVALALTNKRSGEDRVDADHVRGCAGCHDQRVAVDRSGQR
jgi:hypothetical protein